MPAASFLAKLERDSLLASTAKFIFPKLSEVFEEGNDELFKEVVVADFLFRGIKDGVVDFFMNGPLSSLIKKRLPDVFR